MAVSFVSELEPTWQMIGALIRCKHCKPGIFSVKSGDKPPKMNQRCCDSLYSVSRLLGPMLMSGRGWWALGTASSRIPPTSPESGGSCHTQLYLYYKNIWSTFYLWRCLSVSAPNICLSWSASLCLCPEVLLMRSQKHCDKTKKNLESLWKRARPRELVTDCQWESSGRKTRAMWPLMRRRVGFETKLIYLILQLGEMSPRHRW